MKKTDFINIIAETYKQHKSLKEYDDRSIDSIENQETPEYYDQPKDYYKPSKTIGNFNSIDWKLLHDAISQNDEHFNKMPNERPKISTNMMNVNDMVDGFELNNAHLNIMDEIVDMSDTFPIFTDEKYRNFETFISDMKQQWDKYLKFTQTDQSNIENIYEQHKPLLKEKITKQQFITEIKSVLNEMFPTGSYRVTMDEMNNNTPPTASKTIKVGKHILKVEQVNGKYIVRTENNTALTLGATKEKYDQIIQDVANGIYDDYIARINPKSNIEEYSEGNKITNPSTEDPTIKPENITAKGKGMEEIGKQIQQIGYKSKELEDRLQLKEYVQQTILPATMEIIKKAENPRATKKELLEMFKK